MSNYKFAKVSFNFGMSSTKSPKQESSSKESSASITSEDFNILRASAPIIVKGIEVVATHQSCLDKDNMPFSVKKTFYLELVDDVNVYSDILYFADDKIDANISASMDIPIGLNKFEAKSIVYLASDYWHQAEADEYYEKNRPKDGLYSSNITKYESYMDPENYGGVLTNTQRKLNYYSKQLMLKQPIYSEYIGNNTLIIKAELNNIAIEMLPKNVRYSIVVENYTTANTAREKKKEDLKLVISYDNTSLDILCKNGSTSAIVLNSESYSGQETNIKLYRGQIQADGSFSQSGTRPYYKDLKKTLDKGKNYTLVLDRKTL